MESCTVEISQPLSRLWFFGNVIFHGVRVVTYQPFRSNGGKKRPLTLAGMWHLHMMELC